MFLKMRVKCKCFCSYEISNTYNQKEVKCPNCGFVVEDSAKIIELLQKADQIKDTNFLSDKITYQFVTESEELKNLIE